MSGLSPQIAAISALPDSRVSIRKTNKIITPRSASPSTEEESIISITEEQNKISGFVALFGGFLLQLTLGSTFCFGNLVPYIASHMTYFDYRFINNENMSNEELEYAYNHHVFDINWILFVIMLCVSLFIIFGGNLEVYMGPTKTLIISSLLVTFGFGLTYVSLIYNSFWLLIITYGIIFGCGVGIGYPVLVIVCMRWFPLQRGLMCGIISAVFGSGAFVFAPIQTKLVNPSNLPMNHLYGYTLEYGVIERIPFMFAYVAAIMLTMQIISIMCIRSPPWFISEKDIQLTIDESGRTRSNVSRSQLQYEAFSLTLKESVKFCAFWELWITNFLYCIVLMFVTSQWKVFGMNYLKIDNDQMLSFIGSIASLINGTGRFLWGIFYDWNKSFKLSMGLQTSIITAFMITLPFIKFITDSMRIVIILYAFWLWCIWFCVGCQFAFLPSCLSTTFGAKYVGSIVGTFVMSEAPSTMIIVLLSRFAFVNTEKDWIYYCCLMAICAFMSTILSVLYKGRIDRRKYLLSKPDKKIYGTISSKDTHLTIQ